MARYKRSFKKGHSRVSGLVRKTIRRIKKRRFRKSVIGIIQKAGECKYIDGVFVANTGVIDWTLPGNYFERDITPSIALGTNFFERTGAEIRLSRIKFWFSFYHVAHATQLD